MLRLGGTAGAVALAITLCACSTSDFKQPIGEFSKATTDASKAFGEYADALDQLKHDQTLSDVSQPGLNLDERGCEPENAKECVLLVNNGRSKTPLKSALLPNTRKLMAAISTYADNLNDIAKADDVAALTAAADAVSPSIIALAKAADTVNAQRGQKTNLTERATTLATPAGEIFSIALTKYADYRKLEALKDAAHRMQAIFPDAMKSFARVAGGYNKIVRINLFAKLVTARTVYFEAVNDRNKATQYAKNKPPQNHKEEIEHNEALANLAKNIKEAAAAYGDAADAYNKAITAKPYSVYTQLGNAHTALVKALDDPNPDFTTVFTQIQQVAETAAKLAADAQALDTALRSSAGT